MKKILITGMTASQYSKKYLDKHWTYSSGIISLLAEQGHHIDVGFENPDSNYDHIFVGLSSLMSVSSNGVFPALATISHHWGSGKLTFFIDGPMVGNISDSIFSISKDATRLFKPLNESRKGYPQTELEKAAVLKGVQFLNEEEWPTTLVPVLPWEYTEDIQKKIPFARVFRLNLDEAAPGRFLSENAGVFGSWVSNHPKSAWTIRQLNNTTGAGVVTLKPYKHASDFDISSHISSQIGFLLSPEKDKIVYWNPHILSSLHLGIPIATEITKNINLSGWGVLPSTIGDLPIEVRFALATEQKNSYLGTLPSREVSSILLNSIVNGEFNA